MVDSVWRGSRSFVRWAAICTQMAFYGTQIWQVLYVWAYINYVNLSRVFAVQLFSMFIGHYAALPPVRYDPHWPHSHAITASIRLPRPPHPCTATRTARDSNLGSGNHDMPRLSALAYPNDSPIHGLADIPLRLLPTDVGCGTLAPRSQTTHGNTHCSRLRPRQ
jgi:hypothetical protein